MGLNERVEQTIADSIHGQLYSAVVFLDLDYFKKINNEYGHNAADTLLVEVAHRLAGSMRDADTVAPFGGDELVVVLYELAADKIMVVRTHPPSSTNYFYRLTTLLRPKALAWYMA